ncbi:MAG: bacterial Ig-like domain-containing protein [Paludibacteraceae bacterium]|nr:bacterial Ig-like domain-containing protein [Paludibacteraceae bacterium]
MKKLTLLLSAMLLACATNLWAETATYQHVFNAKPSTGNNITLSGVSWNITATALNNYNNQNYAGVQFGSKSGNGEITLTSSSDWNFNGNTKITEVRLWLNLGGTSVTPSVTIGGKPATSDGTTVIKNSSAGSDWTKATKVTFTPAADGNTGVVVINVTSVMAGYICAMEIDSESDNTPAATLSTIALSGTPTKKTYMAGESLNTDGLVVTGTYSDGSTQAITEGITWEIDPDPLTAGITSVDVMASVKNAAGKDVTSDVYTVTGLTVTAAKTLTSIAVSGTPAEFWKGDTFNHNDMTVTATWDDASTTDVTTEATFSTPDMTTAGTKTITVSYKEKTATYDITVKTIANTQETAYTVAEAIALIVAGKDLTTEVFVKGIVSEIVTPWSDTYNNITYNISDDGSTTSAQFQLFRCKTNGANVGDVVIAKGVMTKYNSTYEFGAGNTIVEILENTNPLLTCAESVAFGNISSLVGTVPSETLVVTAKNLTEDIIVTLSADAAFTLSTNTLPAEGGSIAITPVLTVGENTATLTLTSGEKSVAVTLTATIKQAYTISWVVNGVAYTTGEPTASVIEGEKVTVLPTAPADNTLSCSTLFVGWSTNNLGSTAGQTQPDDLFTTTGAAPVVTENTTYHAVFATADGEAKEYFKETFDKTNGTGGNDGSWNGTIASSTLTTDNTGWTFTKEGGAKQCAKLGSSSAQGSATTPALTGLTGNAVLTFRAGAWKGDASSLSLSISAGKLSVESVTLTDAAFSTYTIDITDATEESKITFKAAQASSARFFLDDVVVKSAVTLKDFRTNCEGVSTAISSAAVETPAVKTIENGQLVILRDGVKYNVMGVRLQ